MSDQWGLGLGSIEDYPNLKPWPKGVSGNPKGRPKKKSFEQIVSEKLDLEVRPGESAETRMERIAEEFVLRVLKGSRDDFAHFIKRLWPEIAKHQVAAEIDVAGEIDVAAEELARILEGRE